jgi:hypothetical protein
MFDGIGNTNLGRFERVENGKVVAIGETTLFNVLARKITRVPGVGAKHSRVRYSFSCYRSIM